MNGTFICVQLDIDTARRRLQRRPGWRWRAALRVFTRAVDTGPRHLELIWLPFYHVVFQSSDQNSESVTLNMLIDGNDRRATFWDMTSIQWELRQDHEQFEPSFDVDMAHTIAQRALFEAGLRGKGWRRHSGTWAIGQVRTVHYPYWVAYYECRQQRIDVILLDAVTGQFTGPSGKIALLAALAQTRQPSTTGREAPRTCNKTPGAQRPGDVRTAT